MTSLLKTLTETVAPAIAERLGSETDLSADRATEAVPAVARPVVDGIRSALNAPADHAGALGSLYAFLGNADRPVEPGAAPMASAGGPTLQLVEQFTGLDLGAFAAQVGDRLGVAPSTAERVIRIVTPQLFAVLRGRVQADGFEGLVESVVGSGQGDTVKRVLAVVQGAGAARSTLDRLKGMFGGKG